MIPRWAFLAAAVAILVSIAIRLAMNPMLTATGIDPIFGTLFSENPILQFAALVQLVGAIAASVGGVIAILRKRP